MSFDLKQYLVNLSTKVKHLEERSNALEERNQQLEQRLHGVEHKVTQLASPPPTPPPITRPPVTEPPHTHGHGHAISAEDGLKAFADGLISHNTLPPPPQSADDIMKEMLDVSGKANYILLKKLAREKSEREFHDIIRHPVLMGAALFRGATESQGNSGDVDATVMFLASASRKPVEEEKVKMDLLERSIYPLHRRRPVMPGTGVTPVFSIGRNEENDMVMPDPTISKKQAEIRINHEGISNRDAYFMRDLGSTNEIRINGNKLNSFDLIELKLGDEIKLGRYFFIFTPVTRLRKKLLED